MSKKLTTEEFIQKARAIHGDRYDYSKVEYVNAKTKIIIGCPEHGEFLQTPTNHMYFGCNKCGTDLMVTKRKSNTEEFIEKAREVHGDKYDYSKVDYVTVKIRITIICPLHGEFKQIPNNHLNGHGCPECKTLKTIERCQYTTDMFIEKAREVHGDKYDYSKVDYVNSLTKVTITCPIHGDFEQAPFNHLRQERCPKCSGKGFEYLPFDEVKKIIGPLNIRTKEEYHAWWNENKSYCQKIGIPKSPDVMYEKNK